MKPNSHQAKECKETPVPKGCCNECVGLEQARFPDGNRNFYRGEIVCRDKSCKCHVSFFEKAMKFAEKVANTLPSPTSKPREYPSELAMKITDIVLNKEVGWSERLETLIRTEIEKVYKNGKQAGRLREARNESCVPDLYEQARQRARQEVREEIRKGDDAYCQFVADVLDGVKPETAYKKLNKRLSLLDTKK